MRLSRPDMKTTGSSSSARPTWLDIVSQQVGSLRYGTVQIVVHESKVVQIEKTEKVRPPDFASELTPIAHPKTEGSYLNSTAD